MSSLSLTNKTIYRLIRPILFYSPKITSFSSLNLFNRTLTQATYLGRADRYWSSQQCINQTKRLNIQLDSTKGGQPPTAILISRILQSIERRCPDIDINLSISRCKCDATPVVNLGQEIFPRVKYLTLYVGKHDPEETHPRRRDVCFPNLAFWSPYFDGDTFPDLRSLEIRHFWRIEPPQSASLDLSEYTAWSRGFGHDYHTSPGTQKSLSGAQEEMAALNVAGLEGLREIKLELVPELNATVLMQLLGNPNAVAANLTILELRFCGLSDDMLQQLLFHAPPNLQKFVLLCRSYDEMAWSHWDEGKPRGKKPHLCPLLREFAKRLSYLEFGASQICRHLFLDEFEIAGLRKEGILTSLGGEGGALLDRDRFDSYAIQRTLDTYRNRRRVAEREKNILKAVGKSRDLTCDTTSSCSHFDGSREAREVEQIKRKAERMLDEQDEQASRLIFDAKTPWMRRYITWNGMVSVFLAPSPSLSIA